MTKQKNKPLPKPDERIDEKYKTHWDPIHLDDAKNPMAWMHSAEQLFLVAKKIHKSIDQYNKKIMAGHTATEKSNKTHYERAMLNVGLIRTYMMIMAFAIENIIKGILINRNPTTIVTRNNIKWDGAAHDLLALAKQTETKLAPDEEKILLELAMFGIWSGRYPCPKDITDHYPRTNLTGGFSPTGKSMGSGD